MAFIENRKLKGNYYLYECEGTTNKEGEPRKKTIQYIGRTDTVCKNDISEPYSIRSWGDAQVLLSLIEEIDLVMIVNEIIPKGGGVDPGNLLSILAMNRLLDPCAKSKVSRWYKRVDLESVLRVKASKLNAQNLCAFLDYLTDERVEKIERAITEKLVQNYQIDTGHVIYDITSVYTHGSIDGLSKHGHSRDHRPDLEQVNIGLAVTRSHFMPIMHNVFEGNVPDVSSLPSTARTLESRRGEDDRITLVHDRGFLSADNVRLLDSMKFDFVCGATKTNVIMDVIRKAKTAGLTEIGEGLSVHDSVEEVYGKERRVLVLHRTSKEAQDKETRARQIGDAVEELDELRSSVEKRCKEHDVLVVAIHKATDGVRKYFDIEIDDLPASNIISVERKENVDVDGRKLTWIEKRWRKVLPGLESSDLSNREIRSEIREFFGDLRKYYDVGIERTKARSTFRYAINENEIGKAERFDGYFVLMSSNLEHSMNDIIELYDAKDGVEKSFCTIKHPIRINPIRHWNPQRVRGHIFVCVIAYLLYSVMRYRLRTAGSEKSVDDVLSDLGDVKRVKQVIMKGEKYKIIDSISMVPKETGKFLEIFDIRLR